MIPTSRSLLAPLVVAVSEPPPSAASLGNALLAAADSIPETAEAYEVNVGGFFKAKMETHFHTHAIRTAVGDNAGDFGVQVGLGMQPGAYDAGRGVGRHLHWLLGLRTFTGDPFDAFPAGTHRVGVLETVMVRVTREGFVGATELALLRHLWLTSLRTHYPDLIVWGGRGDWSDTWSEQLTQPIPSP